MQSKLCKNRHTSLGGRPPRGHSAPGAGGGLPGTAPRPSRELPAPPSPTPLCMLCRPVLVRSSACRSMHVLNCHHIKTSGTRTQIGTAIAGFSMCRDTPRSHRTGLQAFLIMGYSCMRVMHLSTRSWRSTILSQLWLHCDESRWRCGAHTQSS